tara:strand:+ start:40 stop:219 length:180 start_codon:yes stop_codon:yes gene_type:complete
MFTPAISKSIPNHRDRKSEFPRDEKVRAAKRLDLFSSTVGILKSNDPQFAKRPFDFLQP